MGKVLLSFDVEEFDLPREHGVELGLEEEVKVSAVGLERVLEMLERGGGRGTMFCTGTCAQKQTELVRAIERAGHEVGAHGVDHFQQKEDDYAKAKQILEAIIGVKIKGYRVPRMQQINEQKMVALGYEYDSSVNPTWIPGRYNNWKIKRAKYRRGAIWEIPASVVTGLRIPLFWLALHWLPVWMYLSLAKRCLKETGYLAIYFHPWEFGEIKKLPGVPAYIKLNSGEKMIGRLAKVIRELKKTHDFITYGEF